MIIIALMAMQTIQAQPMSVSAQPIAREPILATPMVAPISRKGRMIADGRALLAKAETVSQTYAPTSGQPSKAELQASVDAMKSDLDSMSEMGETESLRLQMAMDRMSKMMSTLSNLLKKISDTQQSITQNIK